MCKYFVDNKCLLYGNCLLDEPNINLCNEFFGTSMDGSERVNIEEDTIEDVIYDEEQDDELLDDEDDKYE